MKYLSVSIVVLILASACDLKSSEAADVPKKTIKAFETSFPNVKTVDWDSINPVLWEATFSYIDTLRKAVFNNKGEWLYTKTRLEEMPAKIANYPKFSFASSTIHEIWEVQTMQNKEYEIHLTEVDERLILHIRSDYSLFIEPLPPLEEELNQSK